MVAAEVMRKAERIIVFAVLIAAPDECEAGAACQREIDELTIGPASWLDENFKCHGREVWALSNALAKAAPDVLPLEATTRELRRRCGEA